MTRTGRERTNAAPPGHRAGGGRWLAATLALAAVLACGDGRLPPAKRDLMVPLDCAHVRDETIRACVNGFHAHAERLDERTLEFRFAVQAACPYAGAIAWSGCHRGAFAKFAGRSAHGRCGDEADYIETAVLTSCMRPSELPVEIWNPLVKRCFGWAAEGSTQFKARCAGPQPR